MLIYLNRTMQAADLLTTFDDVIATITAFKSHPECDAHLRMLAQSWENEYNSAHHDLILEAINRLLRIPGDDRSPEFEVPEDDCEFIRQVGVTLHQRGGFTAQQASFYIACNFIAPGNRRMNFIKYCWNEAGQWQF